MQRSGQACQSKNAARDGTYNEVTMVWAGCLLAAVALLGIWAAVTKRG
ncbi:MAG TPA: hypothetical protein VGF59_04465 [Bryobacteraceae bacterium]|jgi:hypothetical protein